MRRYFNLGSEFPIATANDQQTMKLNNDPIKSADEYKLYSFKFIGGLFRFSFQLGNS